MQEGEVGAGDGGEEDREEGERRKGGYAIRKRNGFGGGSF